MGMWGGWQDKVNSLPPGGGARAIGSCGHENYMKLTRYSTELMYIKLPMYLFFMALGLKDFNGGKSITQAIGRGLGPENPNIFGPKSRFSGHTPSSGP